MPANLKNSTVASEQEKFNFHSNHKERQCQRMFSLLHSALISHASKVVLKILYARLQQYVNCVLQDVQTGFRKGRGEKKKKRKEKAENPEIKLQTSVESWKKQESSRKTSTSALLIMPKPLTVWITTNCGRF